MSVPILSAQGVEAGYRDQLVLHGVSLEVWPGELVAILGPNGAGKSTLLKVLSGAIAPGAGEVRFDGRPLAAYSRRQLARQLAVLGQETPISFAFNVVELVLMGRAPHLASWRLEGSQDVALANQALALLGLTELAARPISELSGGERRRAFLARVLAQEPALALLDEPTAFLDLKHVGEIFAVLARLRRERQMAVIASLHDLNAAALYADRVLLLKDGRAVGSGQPEQILTAANLELAYGTRVYVGRNPASGAVAVLPLAQ
ncbi:MAG TPA: ABC transporter ATP-binding protein [Candidatus Binataceae bacterium]|nr:ABC transporter ATP-binding protein [Candidatus Binataceae bacterium]